MSTSPYAGEVFFASLSSKEPTYHLIPNWHAGEGRVGDEIVCNTIVYVGTDNLVGTNGGRPLPDKVQAPCGWVVFKRLIQGARRRSGPTDVVVPGRMVEQGYLIPTKHAVKFGRPCKRCFPERAQR